MKLPSIKNVKVKGKRVLLRVDFNVLIEKGKVKEIYKIERTLPTISLLKKRGAKIILISHVTSGRAKSLHPTARHLNKHFKIKFLADRDLNLIKKKTEKIKNGEIVMLENLRVYKGEKANSKTFAKQLAQLGDIYVNEAFGVSHRKHASLVEITKHLPSYSGLLFESELKNLQRALTPKHPFLLIVGGIKFKSKLGVLNKFIKTADKIFVGGALANNFFRAKGIDIKKSTFDKEADIKKYLNNPKIIIPEDVRMKDEVILDAGPKTIKSLSKIIKQSKFIVWNGPLGNFEVKGYDKGTKQIARAIASSKAISVIGGGDTVAVVHRLGILNKFSFVSTGGGAMLEFLAKGTLPGIEALKSSKKR